MMKILRILFPVTCCYLWVSETRSQCFQEACVCGTTYLMCQDPRPGNLLPPLSFDLDTATELPDGALPSNLSEFHLMNNSVTIIDDAAFDGSANSLLTITITDCKLSKIPNAFLKLKAVIYLTILDTYILDWNSNVMISISQTLTSLSLTNVGLNVWPSWLRNFSKLTQLTIKSSSISSIPDDAFDLMSTSLASITFNNVGLLMVPKAFSKLMAANNMYLVNNMISNVTWLPKTNTLSILDLTGNNITDAEDLSKSLRPYGSSLLSLELNYNQLTSIPDLNFVAKITELDIANNRISNPSSGSWPPKLYDVNLGNNLLPSIPKIIPTQRTITSMRLPFNVICEIKATDFSTTVYTVELQYNLITELTDTSFPENASIVSLYLNNNLINKISASAFVNLVHLLDLHLGGNKLLRMPLALAPLRHLETLGMSDNPGLVCTCLEKSLKDVIVPIASDMVEGDCGHVSIYDFYMSLSMDCPD